MKIQVDTKPFRKDRGQIPKLIPSKGEHPMNVVLEEQPCLMFFKR